MMYVHIQITKLHEILIIYYLPFYCIFLSIFFLYLLVFFVYFSFTSSISVFHVCASRASMPFDYYRTGMSHLGYCTYFLFYETPFMLDDKITNCIRIRECQESIFRENMLSMCVVI